MRSIYDVHPPPKMTLGHTKTDQDYAIGEGDPPLLNRPSLTLDGHKYGVLDPAWAKTDTTQISQKQ